MDWFHVGDDNTFLTVTFFGVPPPSRSLMLEKPSTERPTAGAMSRGSAAQQSDPSSDATKRIKLSQENIMCLAFFVVCLVDGSRYVSQNELRKIFDIESRTTLNIALEEDG